MNLNNGRFEVETASADLVGESQWQRDNDGYSHETDKKFYLYSTPAGNYFITMQYIEYIAGCLPKWMGGRSGMRRAEGLQLIDVYKTIEEARNGCIRYRIPVPAQFIEKVA